MKLYKQYRKRLRLNDYDYSNAGYYFVTICTKDKGLFFGNIEKEKMILSGLGEIVEKHWIQIPEHYQNVILDEYVILPNHIHGIIIICGDSKTGQCPVTTDMENDANRKYGILSKVINSYKGIVTKMIKRTRIENNFAWQRSFYDRVIRNDEELLKTRQYIQNNPLKWSLDDYYSK